MQIELTNNSNWQSDISKIIDWDAFGIVFRDTYVIEWVHTIFQDGPRYASIHATTTTPLWIFNNWYFPTCNKEEETMKHIMKCQIWNT